MAAPRRRARPAARVRGSTLGARPPVTPALSVQYRPAQQRPCARLKPLPQRRWARMSPYPDLFDECRVVRAGGELDVTTAPAFAHDLEAARSDGGPPFLIVDLRDVTFMDGSVLDALCAAWHD